MNVSTPAIRPSLRHLARHPILLFWALFVATIPIYVGKSGLPQPGNLVLFILVPYAFAQWDSRLDSRTARIVRALLWFTIWVTAVNFTWAIATGKFSTRDYAIFPLYYAFNAAVLFAAIIMYRQHGEVFLWTTVYSVLFAVGYQVIASFIYRSDLYRGTLFFNNPNQLGYWALLAACMISLTQRRLRIRLPVAGAAITGCAYLATLSASRAAVAGIAILLILLVFSNPRLIIIGILAAVGFLSLGGPLAEAIDSSKRRALETNAQDGTFIEERGYDRLWQYKEHLLLGAGEGDLTRFSDEYESAREIHSSAATVLFSYGVIGAVLFMIFVVRVISGSELRASLMLVPTLVYTIAHQGLRFAMLWVLLAIFVALSMPSRAKVVRAR